VFGLCHVLPSPTYHNYRFNLSCCIGAVTCSHENLTGDPSAFSPAMSHCNRHHDKSSFSYRVVDNAP
jgi:hypothetical protein